MGCCLTRHTSRCFFSNKIEHELTLSEASVRYRQQPPATATTGSRSAISLVEPSGGRSSGTSKQRSVYSEPQRPLDSRQLYTLRKSWKAISQNLPVTAVNIFVRLFETNAELKEMFSSVQHTTTIAELRTSKLLEKHAMKVIAIVNDTITNLHEMDYVVKLLHLTAHSHCQLPHFAAEFFLMEEPFMLAVKDELGDEFTDNVETVYRLIIRFILTQLSNELTKASDAHYYL